MASKLIYLAAAFTEIARMRDISERLRDDLGWEITSTWIDHEPGTAPMGRAELTDAPDGSDYGERKLYATRLRRASRAAQQNMRDLLRADMLMLFTDVPSTSGGLHTELGVALASRKAIFLIGPRLNVFQAVPEIGHFGTFDEFLMYMKGDEDLCLQQPRPARERGAERAQPGRPLSRPRRIRSRWWRKMSPSSWKTSRAQLAGVP